MSIASILRLGLAGGLAMLLLAGPAARPAPAATVEYASEHYRVFTRAGGDSDESEVNFTPQGGGVLTAFSDGSTAGFRSTASATQEIRTGDDGFLFTGRLAYDVAVLDAQAPPPATGGAAAGFEDSLRFTITEPHRYRFFFGGTTEQESGSRAGEIDYRLLGGDGEIVFTATQQADEGTLQPGEYAFSFVRETGNGVTGSGEPGTFEGTYRVGLGLTPVNGGGGANAIPLPPGVWGGLVTLAGAALVVWLRRARR